MKQGPDQGAGSPRAGLLGAVAVLVPVKAFSEAKLRLAPALPPLGRAELARAMATHVLAAAHPLPTAVVCDDIDTPADLEERLAAPA